MAQGAAVSLVSGSDLAKVRSWDGGSPELELRAAHDECREEVEGICGVGGGQVGDLFVNQLHSLSRDVATNQGGLQDVEGDVLACRVGRLNFAGFGREDGFGVPGVWRVPGCGLVCRGSCRLGHEAHGEDVGGVELLICELAAG